MSFHWLILAAALAVFTAGCCHPCCQRGCQLGCAPACGPALHHGPMHCHGGYPRDRLCAHWNKVHSWFQPPRPAEITPPLPRFHPVPARPVFEYPEGDVPVGH